MKYSILLATIAYIDHFLHLNKVPIPPSTLGPLRLEPIYKEALWGREVWLASDHLHGTSRIVSSAWEDKTLSDLVQTQPQALFGRTNLTGCYPEQFPLIIKLIDAREPLSVQVHPNAAALKHFAPASLVNDRPKTEAWYIVEAKPQSCYWAGLSNKESTETLRQSCDDGTLSQRLHQIVAEPGDCTLLPPGTLHAIGAGVVVLEVQTRCDVTFRLFDWNRLDASGMPRRLDTEAALASVIHTEITHTPDTFGTGQVDVICDCEEFQVSRICLDDSTITTRLCDNDGRFHIWVVVSGTATASFAHFPDEHLQHGELLLTPASASPLHWTAENTILLDIWIP